MEGTAALRKRFEAIYTAALADILGTEDSTLRWELEATQEPVSVGQVRIEPGDWVAGDEDGVVVVPSAIVESVLTEADEKAATESEIRAAVRNGMPPLEAYERYGTF
jgi:4-hydroxy-4-methyl-2-oxoglutarate aldolase